MKKFSFVVLVLSVLLCFTITGCSKKESASSVLAIPENITSIEASGYYNGELEPWELTQAQIDELGAWITQLSLKHRTYAEGETPNKVWNGGVFYGFNINDGEISFAWVHSDKVYILYDSEWYEITNISTPPLGLAGPGKPGK